MAETDAQSGVWIPVRGVVILVERKIPFGYKSMVTGG
jgi:hypothetical protein